MSEQRTADRVDHRLAVEFARGGAALTWALSANVAPGGLFIVSSTPPRPGTALTLEVDLPDCILRVSAYSVWQRVDRRRRNGGPRSGFGVRLGEPPPEWLHFVRGLKVAP